jgi:hypothetical protein
MSMLSTKRRKAPRASSTLKGVSAADDDEEDVDFDELADRAIQAQLDKNTKLKREKEDAEKRKKEEMADGRKREATRKRQEDERKKKNVDRYGRKVTSISSETYFGLDQEEVAADRVRLNQFQGARSIGSDQFFGREEEGGSHHNAGPDLSDLAATARDKASQLKDMASSFFSRYS